MKEFLPQTLFVSYFSSSFLPDPNMAKLTARKSTTELLMVTGSSVRLEIKTQSMSFQSLSQLDERP